MTLSCEGVIRETMQIARLHQLWTLGDSPVGNAHAGPLFRKDHIELSLFRRRVLSGSVCFEIHDFAENYTDILGSPIVLGCPIPRWFAHSRF
jgi:hypothetical protein